MDGLSLLREHGVTLRGRRVVLRPMTEGDWDLLIRWNADPEVLYYVEGDAVSSRTTEELRSIYRQISQAAFCFIAEHESGPIGECWLQRMNLERILLRYSGIDVRRIDLVIGEKGLWGRGLGTEMVDLLTSFGFRAERADVIFGCEIADYNPRSLGAFRKNGYEIDARLPQPEGNKARFRYDVALSRERYLAASA
jgi:RimJ/RimL family protein N-acetyltransferase